MDPIDMRDIAHDLRQPLSTIEAIAYYLTLVLPRDDGKTHQQLDRLQQLVEQSNWILSNSLHLTDPAVSAPGHFCDVDIEELITQTLAARPGPGTRLELCGGLPQVRSDPVLARALIENLLTLFRQISTELQPATVRTSYAGGVVIDIHTEAPGFRSIAGGSLSIESARRIVEAHSGVFDVSCDAAGARLLVVLP
jgi:signal transduction histidine kinase